MIAALIVGAVLVALHKWIPAGALVGISLLLLIAGAP